MSQDTHRRILALKRTLGCCLVLVGLAGIGWGQERAPGLVLCQLTHDGKSYTDRGTGFAPAGDHVSFFKQAQAVSPVGWPMICGWSPDGTKIAYILANKNEGNSEASVCVYDLANGETRRTSAGYRRGDFGEGEEAPPSWSPDGKWFAYHILDHTTDITHLWSFRAFDGEARKLTPNLQGTSSGAPFLGRR